MGVERRFFLAYLGLAVFSVVGSALSRFTHLEPGPIAPVASAVTLLVGFCTAAICLIRAGVLETQVIAVGALGLIVELVGLSTGFPFGRYRYTDAWAPTIVLPGDLRFPVFLPVAWVMMVASSWCLVASVSRIDSRWTHAVIVGFVASVADLVMEPIIVHRLRYWGWLDGGPLPGHVPVWNFVGWFVVSFLAGTLLGPPKAVEPETRFGAGVLAVHLGMLTLIGLIR